MKVLAVPSLTLVIAFCSFASTPPRLAAAAEPPIAPERRDAIVQPVNAWVRAFSTQQQAFPGEFPPFAWSPGTTTVRQWYAEVEGLDTAADRQVVGDGSENKRAVRATRAVYGRRAQTEKGWRMIANAWGILAG